MNTKSVKRRFLKGQTAILLTLALPALLGAIGLCTDSMLMYLNWEYLQKAADSAALAGAGYLPDASFSGANGACAEYASDAQKAACNYVLSNNVMASEIQSIQVASDSKSITVKLQRTVPGFFARVLGLNNFPVSVTAKAVSTPVSAVYQPIPIGVQYSTPYSNGEVITLNNGGYGPGDWGGLALGCTGAACYTNNLLDNYQGEVSVSDIVSSEPGAKTGPTSKAINTRIANGLAEDPSGTWDSHTFNDPRVAVVALVDWTGCVGSCSVPVEGFATVWLTGMTGSTINAIFIGQAFNTPLYTSIGSIDAGTYRVALVQ